MLPFRLFGQHSVQFLEIFQFSRTPSIAPINLIFIFISNLCLSLLMQKSFFFPPQKNLLGCLLSFLTVRLQSINQKVFFGLLSTHGVLFLMHLIIFKQGRSCVLGVYIQDLRPSRDCICFWKSAEGTSNCKIEWGVQKRTRYSFWT